MYLVSLGSVDCLGSQLQATCHPPLIQCQALEKIGACDNHPALRWQRRCMAKLLMSVCCTEQCSGGVYWLEVLEILHDSNDKNRCLFIGP